MKKSFFSCGMTLTAYISNFSSVTAGPLIHQFILGHKKIHLSLAKALEVKLNYFGYHLVGGMDHAAIPQLFSGACRRDIQEFALGSEETYFARTQT
jgi:hypothetical protein